jgi:mannose-6-phosphate isomerase
LQPIFSPRIWGVRSLAPLYPEKKNLAEPIGEAWLTGRSCRFANGPFAGRQLGEAWQAMPPEWRGARLRDVSEFPILVKFIFPDDKLSIQVHPDDGYAREHEAAAGGLGKTEMWYAISAQPGAEVLLGLKPGLNAGNLRRAIAEGTVEETLTRVSVHTGDSFFVPAGTPHTIGPKMMLCEVQEYSDLTYRIYDYNRVDASGLPRDLHVEKALAVMRFDGQTGGKLEPARISRGLAIVTYLVACSFFATEKWEFWGPVNLATNSEHFHLLMVLEGTGSIRWNRESGEYRTAETWLIPAGLGPYELAPASATKLLRTYVPNLDEFVRTMASQGFDEQTRSRVVFS